MPGIALVVISLKLFDLEVIVHGCRDGRPGRGTAGATTAGHGGGKSGSARWLSVVLFLIVITFLDQPRLLIEHAGGRSDFAGVDCSAAVPPAGLVAAREPC